MKDFFKLFGSEIEGYPDIFVLILTIVKINVS